MKTSLKALVLGIVALAIAGGVGHAAPVTTPMERDFWNHVDAMFNGCLVQPFHYSPSGKKVFGHLVTRCQNIRMVDPARAILEIQGQPFFVTMIESSQSDGGDLWNLKVVNQKGKMIANRTNVPAFGDLLLALVGGPVGKEFPQVYQATR